MEDFELPSIDYYLEIGAIEATGIDEDGEILFKITEKAEILAPELWEAHKKHIDDSLISLLEKGLLSVEYDEDLNASISLSEEGAKALKEMGLIPEDN